MGKERAGCGVRLFWRGIDCSDPSGCWEWPRAKRADGYGLLSSHKRVLRAHRVAWELANGPIPKGMQIDHKCLNRSCVNPSHLRLATLSQNLINKPSRKDNRNPYKGVRGKPGHWTARIQKDGVQVHLGTFPTPEDAHAKYCEAGRKIFGEFFNPGAKNEHD